MKEEDRVIITICDDEGNLGEFEIVDFIQIDNNEYFALLPVATGENAGSAGEIFILKSVEEDGEELLEPIEDDAEYESVAEIFTERLKDIYDFES